MAINTFIFSIFIFLHHTSASSLSNPTTGFTANFIHREFSPLSPFYNPSHNKFNRIHNTIRRTFSRLSTLSSSTNTFQSQIAFNHGEYLMNISIGTPPFSILGTADTGSDLTWIQCLPCLKCYKQNSPPFNPSNSTTYKSISCKSEPCAALNSSSSSSSSSVCVSDNKCGYSYGYGDKSYTIGELAQDSLTFESANGGAITFPNVAFGCGEYNKGEFDSATSGIIGLGGGAISIIRQLNKSVTGKFSYCLVPITFKIGTTSTINFGTNAIVTGEKVVSTPLIVKSPDTLYFLNLEKITVGGNKTINYSTQRLNINCNNVEVSGNIIIDSGTTLTLLPSDTYKDLESLVKESLNVEFVKDPSGMLELCYNAKDNNVTVPKITFHFTNADVDLLETTTFIEVGEEEVGEEGVMSLMCFTIVPNDEYVILGNLAQMGYLIGYDLVNRQVSFFPTDCSKQ